MEEPAPSRGFRLDKDRIQKVKPGIKRKKISTRGSRDIEPLLIEREKRLNQLKMSNKNARIRGNIGNSVAKKIRVTSRNISPLNLERDEDEKMKLKGNLKNSSLKGKLPSSFFGVNSYSNMSKKYEMLSPKATPKKAKIDKVLEDKGGKWKIQWNSKDWPDIDEELNFGRCLGQGSFAKVYEGLDKREKKAVAIKVIEKSKLDDEKRRNLAQKEIDILTGLDHPNLCKFFRMLEDHKRVRKSPYVF